MGRRTLYDPSMHPRRAAELAGQGLTDKELAEAFGIGETTLYRWQQEYREFRESIKKAKEKPNREVEAALFKRAIGYTYDADVVTASGEKDAQGANKVLKIVRRKVHVPADPASMIFWLKNRRPDRWRDARRVEHGFDRSDGLEGVTPEDEAAVEAIVNSVLGKDVILQFPDMTVEAPDRLERKVLPKLPNSDHEN